MMRILILGSDEEWSIERYYMAYLREFKGVFVELYPLQNMFSEYYRRNLLNKVLYRAGLSDILQKINTLVLDRVRRYQPEIIWVFKGMELLPSTIEEIKEINPKVIFVNYNPDNPFIFTGRGSGNANVRKAIDLYDHHFSYNLEVMDELGRRNQAEVSFLPFAHDLSIEGYRRVVSATGREEKKTCFVGNPDNERRDFLLALANKGVSIDIFGDNWKRFIDHENIKLFPAARNEAFWITLRRYRVQLNLLRIHNLNSHNMRTFEVPAVGGIQLAPDTKEHRMFFNLDKEIFLFSDVSSCVEKVNWLLNLKGCDADALRNRSRTSVDVEKHSYRARAGKVHEVFVQLIAQRY